MVLVWFNDDRLFQFKIGTSVTGRRFFLNVSTRRVVVIGSVVVSNAANQEEAEAMIRDALADENLVRLSLANESDLEPEKEQ